jgi:hypothetical protein
MEGRLMTDLLEYVEIADRMYAVQVVAGPLFTEDGDEVDALVDHSEQTVSISALSAESERPQLLKAVVSAALPRGWRRVPVVGRVS